MVECEKKRAIRNIPFFPKTNEHGKVWCSVGKVQGYLERKKNIHMDAACHCSMSIEHTRTSPLYPNFLLNHDGRGKKLKKKYYDLHFGLSVICRIHVFFVCVRHHQNAERILTSKCMKNIKILAFKLLLSVCVGVSRAYWVLSVDAIHYVSYDDFKRAKRAHYKYKIISTHAPKMARVCNINRIDSSTE